MSAPIDIEFWRNAKELEMQGAEEPTPSTIDELHALVTVLAERGQDYGTCVYAVSVAATATFNYMARHLGVTGFQASAADMDILRRTRGMERFQVRDLGDLLYPQYEHKFGGWRALLKENADWLGDEARKKLSESGSAHQNVLAHWEWLSAQSPESEAVRP